MLSNQNYKILNIDSIIHAERPKLISYIPDIRRKLADTLSLKLDQVSVKATTMEKLGPVGEGTAISAEAIVLLEKIY